MEPISWGTIISAAKAGDTILDDKKRKSLLTKFKLLLRANRKIVVYGLSGAGKSQFLLALKKQLEIAQPTGASEIVPFNLEDFPIIFIDTPGQSERHFPRKQALTEILKDNIEGIINVVSYGYEERPEFNLDDIFTPNHEVKESFLRLNRKSEVERLAEWLPLIHPKNVKWIINLVNKADLWWDNMDEVNKHYISEDYGKAFKQIDSYTNVITIPFCSIIQPYFNTRTSGKFGDLQKEKLRSNFIHQLHTLIKS